MSIAAWQLLVAVPALLLSPRALSRRPVASPNMIASAPALAGIEQLRFLTRDAALEIACEFGSPVFVYDESTLKAQAASALAFPQAYGLTVRFAMKALPNAAVLQVRLAPR